LAPLSGMTGVPAWPPEQRRALLAASCRPAQMTALTRDSEHPRQIVERKNVTRTLRVITY
jgi:hypothetical protein